MTTFRGLERWKKRLAPANHSFGRINKTVMLIHSWRLWEQRRAAAQSGA